MLTCLWRSWAVQMIYRLLVIRVFWITHCVLSQGFLDQRQGQGHISIPTNVKISPLQIWPHYIRRVFPFGSAPRSNHLICCIGDVSFHPCTFPFIQCYFCWAPGVPLCCFETAWSSRSLAYCNLPQSQNRFFAGLSNARRCENWVCWLCCQVRVCQGMSWFFPPSEMVFQVR